MVSASCVDVVLLARFPRPPSAVVVGWIGQVVIQPTMFFASLVGEARWSVRLPPSILEGLRTCGGSVIDDPTMTATTLMAYEKQAPRRDDTDFTK